MMNGRLKWQLLCKFRLNDGISFPCIQSYHANLFRKTFCPNKTLTVDRDYKVLIMCILERVKILNFLGGNLHALQVQDLSMIIVKSRSCCAVCQVWWNISLGQTLLIWQFIYNVLRPRQNGRHFANDIFELTFLNTNFCVLIRISLKCGSNKKWPSTCSD